MRRVDQRSRLSLLDTSYVLRARRAEVAPLALVTPRQGSVRDTFNRPTEPVSSTLATAVPCRECFAVVPPEPRVRCAARRGEGVSAACIGLARDGLAMICSLYGTGFTQGSPSLFYSYGASRAVALSRRACQGVFFRGRLVASREAAGSVFTGEVVPGVALTGVAPVVLDAHTSHNPRSGFPYVFDTRYYFRRMGLCRLCPQWPCRRVVVRLTGGGLAPWSWSVAFHLWVFGRCGFFGSLLGLLEAFLRSGLARLLVRR